MFQWKRRWPDPGLPTNEEVILADKPARVPESVSELEKNVGDREENEVVRASRLAASLRAAAADKVGGIGWKAAAGIGIGSAAVIAALLYAKTGRK